MPKNSILIPVSGGSGGDRNIVALTTRSSWITVFENSDIIIQAQSRDSVPTIKISPKQGSFASSFVMFCAGFYANSPNVTALTVSATGGEYALSSFGWYQGRTSLISGRRYDIFIEVRGKYSANPTDTEPYYFSAEARIV